MPTYRIRFGLYKMDGDSPEQVKKDVVEIMKKMPEKFITVELFVNTTPFWKRILLGR